MNCCKNRQEIAVLSDETPTKFFGMNLLEFELFKLSSVLVDLLSIRS